MIFVTVVVDREKLVEMVPGTCINYMTKIIKTTILKETYGTKL